MPKTPRYTATIDGQTFSRNSDRTYTHVVVAREAVTYDSASRSYVPTDCPIYYAIGFCGRPELAEKLAQQTRDKRLITGYDMSKGRLGLRNAPPIRDGAIMYRDVTILPLTDTRA